jgi:hypothetical protein
VRMHSLARCLSNKNTGKRRCPHGTVNTPSNLEVDADSKAAFQLGRTVAKKGELGKVENERALSEPSMPALPTKGGPHEKSLVGPQEVFGWSGSNGRCPCPVKALEDHCLARDEVEQQQDDIIQLLGPRVQLNREKGVTRHDSKPDRGKTHNERTVPKSPTQYPLLNSISLPFWVLSFFLSPSF